MAPLEAKAFSRISSEHAEVMRIGQRDGSFWGARNVDPVQADGSPASSEMGLSSYLGIGIGVGGAFLVAIIIVVVQIVRKRIEHNRMLEVLEVEEAVQAAQMQEIGEIPRPTSIARCSTLVPLHARAGWGALSSDETVNEPEPVAGSDKRKRLSVSLPKRIKQRGIPLKRLKRLTAIIESPRSKATSSPAIVVPEATPTQATLETPKTPEKDPKAYTLKMAGDQDVFVCPGSPKPEVLPSFAIRSPGRYGAGIANNDNPKAARSHSTGALGIAIPDNAVLGQTSRMSHGNMHTRSISLGGPPSRPPSGPVPPLPVIQPHAIETDEARQGMCVSRTSSLSRESANSSVLVATPILKMNEQNKSRSSPTVQDVVADDDSASLKTVSKKQWQNPLVHGPRPLANKEATDGVTSQTSIRSNIARYSAESLASQKRLSSASITSSNSRQNRLSIPHIGTADSVSISRVSSSTSLKSISGVQKITTPRKASRTSVSAFGSPAERRKTSILRDISGNPLMPSRQLSNATQDSRTSSNGNPFQWDQPLPKPSALKGSPNARKGHRRQNCVRISTLTPQILGPPPSRPDSPSIMHGIEEESASGEEPTTQSHGRRFVTNQRLSRPPSAASFAPNLRIQTLRASLTPSSPTLSAWNAFNEHGLPSQVSDSNLSISNTSASPADRRASRQSDRSSIYSIPTFPSPSKATVSNVQMHQPVPEFCLSRPSTDTQEGSSSPFDFRLSSDPNIPSSPPLQISKHDEYDPTHPAWPLVSIPAPNVARYDPASRTWDDTEPERSSAFFPFAADHLNRNHEDGVSPRSRPTSYGGDMPDAPPCSPKKLPEEFGMFGSQQTSGSLPAGAQETLTSANASAIMARMPSKVDFPGAPILPPPNGSEEYFETTPRSIRSRQRSASNASHLQPIQEAPLPPIPSLDACIPSPLHVADKSTPQGPRTQPAQSVLKNAMALRRMNSEVNDFPHRESRRYVHLGREASPLLPWIGSPDPSESCADMNDIFDFDFAASTEPGAAQEPLSALDEIDMTEIERKHDGALAGFDAIPSDETVRPHENRSSSVWEDGERFWKQKENTAPQFAFVPSSPLPIKANTPRKRAEYDGGLVATPRSVQATPRSLYDSDGFLRT